MPRVVIAPERRVEAAEALTIEAIHAMIRTALLKVHIIVAEMLFRAQGI